jgi:pyruvate,water dikinase
MVRSMTLRWGEIYQEQGIIENQNDIFYLSLEEIKSLILDKKSMTDVIGKRKDDYRLYECLPAYNRIIFMGKEFNKSHTNVNMKKFYTDAKELRGIPCSNGKVKGEVLVIANVNDVKDVKDKILVTKMTDPGWVFLLATAKGIISEKGSLLSHTAIISRELGIPSIVGVANLLNTVKSGDIIEMDGTTGNITIINK